MRIRDLGATIAGSPLEPRIEQLYQELAAREIAVRPVCYVGDEWFSPAGMCAIAAPFYLTHPRLEALERSQMGEVRGGSPDECQRYLRHECGHALDHAYGFSSRPDWRARFGDPETEYRPQNYRARVYSRSFVHHLGDCYAQAHPEEDFAETFAVWLGSTPEAWRARYRGWKALAKLEYVHTLMQETAGQTPRLRPLRKISEAGRLTRTLARYYAARRAAAGRERPDCFDADLRLLFEGERSNGSAGRLLRESRPALVRSVVRWTGRPKYVVEALLARLIDRCLHLGLAAPEPRAGLHYELAAYLAARVAGGRSVRPR